MANMIYTTYQTNSFKIVKSTFNTYVLAHAPVNFLSISLYSIVLKFRQSLKFPTNCADLWEVGGGGVCPPAPPEFPPLNSTETVEQGGSLVFGPTNNFVSSHWCD